MTVVRRRVLVIVGVTLVGLGALAGTAFLPWSANHFGYALPGERGLPYRVEYHGRHYRSHLTCAGAGWCAAEMTPADRATPYCVSSDELAGPLRPVGEVPTLFGPPHAVVLDSRPEPGGTPMSVLVEATDDCYVGFTLMGGP